MAVNEGFELFENKETDENNDTRMFPINVFKSFPKHSARYFPSLVRKQKIILVIASFMTFPLSYQHFLMVFIGNSPSWLRLYKSNLTFSCDYDRSYSVGDKYYGDRCLIQRSSWKFTEPIKYSIVTEVRCYF